MRLDWIRKVKISLQLVLCCAVWHFETMRFLLGYSVFILLFLVQPSFAQDVVRVRIGEHDGYSRLVFDWKKYVPYTVEKALGEGLIIKFEQGCSIDSSMLEKDTARNINGFRVISKNPLQVLIIVPDNARTRNFYAGNRIVFDVYNIQGNEQVKVKLQKPAFKKESEKVKDVVQDKEYKEEKILVEAVPVESVEVSNIKGMEDGSLKEAPSNTIIEGRDVTDDKSMVKDKKKLSNSPNVITVSSTKSQGLAVFELNGEIWIINDQADLRLTPHVGGSDSDRLSPLQTVEIIGGKAFKTKMLENYNIRGQGGGLLWRVIISPQKHDSKPVEFIKTGVNENRARSGKIVWAFDKIGKILDVQDPVSGANLKIVTVENSKLFAGEARDFVDFSVLPSPVGLAIMPKVDDLKVIKTSKGIEVSRVGGLTLLTVEQLEKIAAVREKKKRRASRESSSHKIRRIYDFKNWQMGGIDSLGENGVILLGGLNALTEGKRIESLVTLAKMYISNAQGAEALGFLRLAQAELSDLSYSPEFIALRGVAKALDWKSEPAFADLSAESLEPFEEIGYWRAAVLADLGDWAQAQDVLPQNMSTLYNYPALVFNRLALAVAEISLRAGKIDQAEELLQEIEDHKEILFKPQVAALAYLKGETARQRGKIDETKKLWLPLTNGEDDLYRAKAGLALTRLRVNQKELTPIKAIDKLERLRYAWRGDLLEAQINYWLGQTYFEVENYVKGLNIMREAVSFAAGTDFGGQIAEEMTDVFTNLFLGDGLKKVSPSDAAALYEQFSELVPIGEKGDKVVEMLANHLMQADLLGRAARLLSHQLEHRLKGNDAHRVAVHLAAIYLLDEQPGKAMNALKRATLELQNLPEEMQTQEKFLEISLLRARSLSKNKRADQAMALLNELPNSIDVNNLRADIAWNVGYWDDAAEALQDVILDRNFSLTRPLSDENTILILHRAIALNLAGDRVALANMREKYTDNMAQTKKAHSFEVITRLRQRAALADRETLKGIVSEVDLFGSFMESYRESQAISN